MTRAATEPRRNQRFVIHGLRIAVFAVIIVLIHSQHAKLASQQLNHSFTNVKIEQIQKIFPAATLFKENPSENNRREVLNHSGESLGYVIQTSPSSDHILGFSGPTNLLIGFGTDDRIVGIEVLSSDDTRDHLQQVQQDEKFLRAFNGLSWNEVATLAEIDAVSGATLTSHAITESIIQRLGGSHPSLRFPEPVTLKDTQKLFPSATAIKQDEHHGSLWHAEDKGGKNLGNLLRTSPAADNIIGYQGPTDALIAISPDGRVISIALRQSYDNQPYVTYVREDEYFLNLFNNRTLQELSQLDLEEAEIEGVSGATMTSMALADGVIAAAKDYQNSAERGMLQESSIPSFTVHDYCTAGIILVGISMSFTSLRRKKWASYTFQFLLVGYLGLTIGNMISLAQFTGWAKNGVAWRIAPGLVVLSIAAFLLPIVTGKNVYCNNLCPHGAAQQILRNRLPWKIRLPKKITQTLLFLPGLLLLWCIIVTMRSLPYSLVDIEPFDGWVFYVAGWASLTIALLGLVASLFMPMAYCRYGCPTGAILKYLRYHSRSDRWTSRDWLALGLVILAAYLRCV